MEPDGPVMINGRPETLPDGCTVEKLLLSKSIDPACVVVEVNKNIVRREGYGETVLKRGDAVEILRFVGGG
jgi:sulfur carrier protein